MESVGDQDGKRLSERFVSRIPEDGFRHLVPEGDVPPNIGHDDGVTGGLHHGVEAYLARLQSAFCLKVLLLRPFQFGQSGFQAFHFTKKLFS